MVSVNGTDLIWEENLTVELLLQRMNYTFPLIIVRINGIVVDQAEWAYYLVPDNAVVQAHHLIAGG